MSSSLNHRDIDTTACRPGPVEPFWEGRSGVRCATNAAEFSVSRPCRGWGVADTKSTGGQIWLDLPELPCLECQDWGRAWGLNRLKLWFKAEQMPVQGRVWFRRESEHVTCMSSLGDPGLALESSQSQPFMPRSRTRLRARGSFRSRFPETPGWSLQPTSPADDGYFGSTGGVNRSLFRLRFLAQPSTM